MDVYASVVYRESLCAQTIHVDSYKHCIISRVDKATCINKANVKQTDRRTDGRTAAAAAKARHRSRFLDRSRTHRGVSKGGPGGARPLSEVRLAPTAPSPKNNNNIFGECD